MASPMLPSKATAAPRADASSPALEATDPPVPLRPLLSCSSCVRAEKHEGVYRTCQKQTQQMHGETPSDTALAATCTAPDFADGSSPNEQVKQMSSWTEDYYSGLAKAHAELDRCDPRILLRKQEMDHNAYCLKYIQVAGGTDAQASPVDWMEAHKRIVENADTSFPAPQPYRRTASD